MRSAQPFWSNTTWRGQQRDAGFICCYLPCSPILPFLPPSCPFSPHPALPPPILPCLPPSIHPSLVHRSLTDPHTHRLTLLLISHMTWPRVSDYPSRVHPPSLARCFHSCTLRTIACVSFVGVPFAPVVCVTGTSVAEARRFICHVALHLQTSWSRQTPFSATTGRRVLHCTCATLPFALTLVFRIAAISAGRCKWRSATCPCSRSACCCQSLDIAATPSRPRLGSQALARRSVVGLC